MRLTDVDRFVDAIAKQGLEAFTERPGDLLDLADYWKSHGKFGSFAEMLEHSASARFPNDQEVVTILEASHDASAASLSH
jgi:hypothetical protein